GRRRSADTPQPCLAVSPASSTGTRRRLEARARRTSRAGGDPALNLDRLFLFVTQYRPQPAFRFGDRYGLAARVVLDLVAADLADHEVARVGVREVQARDGGGGGHRERLGQLHTNRRSVEEIEQSALGGVVGACGIAE